MCDRLPQGQKPENHWRSLGDSVQRRDSNLRQSLIGNSVSAGRPAKADRQGWFWLQREGRLNSPYQEVELSTALIAKEMRLKLAASNRRAVGHEHKCQNPQQSGSLHSANDHSFGWQWCEKCGAIGQLDLVEGSFWRGSSRPFKMATQFVIKLLMQRCLRTDPRTISRQNSP